LRTVAIKPAGAPRRRELDCYQKHKQGEIDALASLAETDQAKRSAEVY
jgi:hypothetical protein